MYEKINFKPETKLKSSDLNHMEEGIDTNSRRIESVSESLKNLSDQALFKTVDERFNVIGGKNLIGDTDDYYPVFLQDGDKLVLSTEYGEPCSVNLLDGNKKVIDTISATSEVGAIELANGIIIKYVRWLSKPTGRAQLERGDKATEYEPYYGNVRYIFEKLMELEKLVK